MSKEIQINEGAMSRTFTASKLSTNVVGGGTCLWVPLDEVQLTTKAIAENGTFKASSDGYYGFSQVTVNVPGGAGAPPGGKGCSVSGKKPNGNDAVITINQDGNIVENELPSRIEVIAKPTNPYGIYQDGQAITTEGMVVKAYLGTGEEYGLVLGEELTLNPTTAVYDASTDIPGGIEIVGTPLDMGGATVIVGENARPTIYYTYVDNQGIKHDAQDFLTSNPLGDGVYYTLAAKIKTARSIDYHLIIASTHSTGFAESTYTYNNQTVYYHIAYSFSGTAYNVESVNGTDAPLYPYDAEKEREIAWSMVYGTKREVRAGSRQQITVSWPRPLDGKVLETTFIILVAPPYTQN